MSHKKVLNVGLIGVGIISDQAHIPAWNKAKGAKIVALADIRKKRAEKMAEKWGVKNWYTDYHRILERDDIDIVDLALPHHLHYQIVCESAESGKHIMVEKPMARNLEEADRMVDIADNAGVKLMVSEFWRYCPIHKKLLSAIEKGYLGEVFMIRSEHCNLGSPGILEPPKEAWKLDLKKTGSGILLGVSCHPLSLAMMLFGEVDTISAMTTRLAKPEWFPDNYELSAMALVNFKNGVVGEITSSVQTIGYFHYKTWVFGSKGSIVTDMVTGELKLISRVLGEKATDYGRPFLGYDKEEPAGYAAAVQHLIDCINYNKEPETSGKVERETIRVLLAGYKSMSEKRIVKVSEVN